MENTTHIQQESERTEKILRWLESFAPLGLIITAACALAQEGYFQFKFWHSAFPNLPQGERWYVAISIATVMAGLRLWFLVMSSRDVAAGNRPGWLIGIGASIATLLYTVWECGEIARKWAGDEGHATIVMFVFTTIVVVAAEIRIMLSRFGSWRNSAQRTADAIEEANREKYEAEAAAREAQAEAETARRNLEQFRKQMAEAEAEWKRSEAEMATSAGTSDRNFRQAEAEVAELRAEVERFRNRKLEAEAEAEAARTELAAFRNTSDFRFRNLEAEVLQYRKEEELRRNRNAARRASTGTSGSASGGSSDTGTEPEPEMAGTGSDWPEVLAEHYRKFVETFNRNPTSSELAAAAGTSDKTERKYREMYIEILKNQPKTELFTAGQPA